MFVFFSLNTINPTATESREGKGEKKVFTSSFAAEGLKIIMSKY